MKINKALDLFIGSRILRGLNQRSIENYQSFISILIDYTNNIELENLTKATIELFIIDLYSRPIKKATIATYLRHNKIFLKWLEDNEYINIPLSKIIHLPKVPKKMLKIYNDDEIKEIFNTIEIVPDWLKYRNCSIIALMLDSGIRQNELCTITIDDISFTDSTIKIHGKGNKERIVPFGSLTQHYLSKYMKLRPFKYNTLFISKYGNPITRNAVRLLVARIKDKLEFEFSSHKLRHNFATNYCLDQYNKFGNVDIFKLMVILGHEDIQTTKRYLHMANSILAVKSHISHLDKVLLGRQ